MERLTKIFNGYFHGKEGKTICEAKQSNEYYRGTFECSGIVDRLGEYEDTGMTPEEIKKISNVLQEFGETYDCHFNYVKDFILKYAEAERDDRLVVLPCKVGDTVYKLSWDCAGGIQYYPFNEDGYSTAGSCLKCEKYPCDIHNAVIEKTVKSLHWILDNQIRFGKTVFLTKEEAEEALRKNESTKH